MAIQEILESAQWLFPLAQHTVAVGDDDGIAFAPVIDVTGDQLQRRLQPHQLQQLYGQAVQVRAQGIGVVDHIQVVLYPVPQVQLLVYRP